jgi:DNA-binding transcriptional ArsR family regulator
MDGWNALADPTRRTILELVAAHPRNVQELADRLPVSRPAVSQHLKLLKEAGLVVDQAVGTRRLNPANRFWGQTLTNFKQQAEAEDQ